VCAVIVACGGKSPTGASTTMTTPSLLSPSNGATVGNDTQPIKLTVQNATGGKSNASLTYTFQVATDAAFATVIATKTAPQGAGQTSVTLDILTSGRDYFWRVKASGTDTAGDYSPSFKFTIGAAVTLGTPVAVSPLTGGTADPKPRLTVTNASHSGSTGAIFYRFDIASTSSFSTVLATATVPEGSGTTSFTPDAALTAETVYFWRAQAVDPSNGAISAFSEPQSFQTTVTIDLSQVNYQRFVNPSAWPITDQIIAVDQDGGDGHMCINHTKRGQWPTSFFEDNPLVPVEATQWYFARINGQWYAGAGEWLRVNQICKEGQRSQDIGHDGTWGGPMDTWIPKRGELVGYMISTPARAWPRWKTIDERSNIVVQPWKVNGVSTP
jgi:hypothetical protein